MNYSLFVQLRLCLFGEYNGPLTAQDTVGQTLKNPNAKSLEKALALLPTYFAYTYAEENADEVEYLFTDGYMRPMGYDLYRYLPDFELKALVEDMQNYGYSREEISAFATAFVKEMLPYEPVFESAMTLHLFGLHQSGIPIALPGIQDFEKALALIPSFVEFLGGANLENYTHEGVTDLGKELRFYISNMAAKGYGEKDLIRFATAWIDAMEDQDKMGLALMRIYLFGAFPYSADGKEYTLPLEGKKNFQKALSIVHAFVEYVKAYYNDNGQDAADHILNKSLLPEMEKTGYAEQEMQRFRLTWNALLQPYQLYFTDGLTLTLEIAEGVTAIDDTFIYSLSLQTLADELRCQQEKESDSAFDQLTYLSELERTATGIKRVIIPSTVKTIDPDVWYDFNSLKEFLVSAKNPYFAAEDGVLFSADRKAILFFPHAKTAQGCERPTYIIPDSVEEIGPYCFSCCESLCALYMSPNLTKIGREALGGHYHMTFQQLYLPPTVTDLDKEIFASDVDDGGVFYSITLVGGAAGSAIEAYCNKKDIYFIEVAENEVEAFYATDCDTLISQHKEKLAAEESYCRDLSQQGYRAALVGDTLTLSALDSAEKTDVEVGTELYSVLSTFRREKVRHIVFGQGITAVAPNTFSRWYPNVESLHLGADLQRFPASSLYKNQKLSNITVDEANTAFTAVDDVLYSHDKTTLVKYAAAKPETSFAIPAQVTCIGEDAFESAENLQCLRVGSNVHTIEAHAFCNTALRHLYVAKEVTDLPEECPFFVYPEMDRPFLPLGFVVGTPAGSAMEAFCLRVSGFIPVHVVEEEETEAFLAQPLPPIENWKDGDKDPYYRRAREEAQQRYDACWAEIDAQRSATVSLVRDDDLPF